MNTNTGEIYTDPDLIEQLKAQGEPIKEMETPPTAEQMRRVPPKVGRNDPCPCGSGLKFKKCCCTA